MKAGVCGILDRLDVGRERVVCLNRCIGVTTSLVEGLPPTAFGSSLVGMFVETAMLQVAIASSLASSLALYLLSPFLLIA